MKVYGKVQSRAFRVLWMLEEMGREYQHVDILPHDARLRAIYPAGKVPVLVDGDVVITDSTAILNYLADCYDSHYTHPTGSTERAFQESLMYMLLDEFDACLWAAARHSFILPEEYRVPDIKPSLKWEFGRSVQSLCSRAVFAPFLTGNHLTVPDFILMDCLVWCGKAGFPITHPVLLEYRDHMEIRPAFRRVSAMGAA
ncbi:MAG: glutathione S-transferase [Rhodobacteraceae bacterium]|nr:glutathione S-transferase [Paracoccaceae bacterium]